MYRNNHPWPQKFNTADGASSHWLVTWAATVA
jgi:hypothetical protein